MFLALTKTSPHGMLLLDQERQVIAANDRIHDLLGYSDLVGHSFVELLAEQDELSNQFIPLGASIGLLKSHSGRRIPAQLTAWELAQEIPFYLCVMVQTQGLFADVRRITVRDMSIPISKDSHIADLLELLLVNINHFIEHDAANVMLLRQYHTLEVVAQRGYEKYGAQSLLEGMNLPLAEHPEWGRIMATARPHFISDTRRHPNWRPRPELAWIRWVINLPILLDGQIVGYINLDSAQPDFFQESHLDYLRFFAHQAATILNDMNLFISEREQRHLLEALYQSSTVLNSTLEMPEVIGQILSSLRAVVPFDAASIMAVEDSVLRTIGHQGYEQYPGGEAVAAFSIYMQPDSPWWHYCRTPDAWVIYDTAQDPHWIPAEGVKWVRSHIHMPLAVKGQVVGILNLESAQPNGFTNDHLTQLQLFATYAATAIQNARLFAAEREQRQFAEVLNLAIAALEHLTDFDELMADLFDNLALVVPYDAANVFIEEEGIMHVAYQRGWAERGQDIAWWNALNLPLDYYPLWAAQNQNSDPKIIYDTLTDPHWQPHPEVTWVRSHIDIPIFIEGCLIGTINLDSAQPNSFTLKHAQFFKPFSYHTAIAVKNARLFAAERDQRQLAQALLDSSQALNSTLNLQEVMQRILENIARIIPHDASNIMLLEGNSLRIITQQGYEAFGIAEWMQQVRFQVESVSIWGQKIKAQTVDLVEDAHTIPNWALAPQTAWIRSHMDMPLVVEGQVIGLVNLDHASPHHFTWRDVEKLLPFVSQAEVAIKNARLFAQEREQRLLAQALRDSGEALNSTLNLAEIMQRILEAISQIVPHRTSNIMMLESDHLRVISQRGYEQYGLAEWILNFRTPLYHNTHRYVRMNTAYGFLIGDTQLDSEWVPIPETAWIRSHLALPMYVEGQIIGFINLDSDQPHHFSQQDMQTLQPLVHQAELALKNAQLFAQEQEQRHLMQVLYDTTAALNQSQTLPQVFEHLLDNIRSLIAYDAANIMLMEDNEVRYVTWRGYEGVYPPHYFDSRFPMAQTEDMLMVAESRLPMIEDDQAVLDSWLVDSTQAGYFKAHIKAPLIISNEVVGFLNLDSCKAHFFTDQHLLQIVAFTVHTATAIRNAQLYEALEHERSYLRAILDGSADGIIYTEDSKIIYTNQAMCEMLGYTPAQLLAIPITKLRNRRAKEPGRTPQNSARDGRLYMRQDVQFYHQDGSLIDVSLNITRLSRNHERPVRAVIIARDVRQEKQLRELQNRFMLHAAHELRHPIANISTRLYLLSKMPQHLEKHLAILQQSVDRLTTLTDHMSIMTDLTLGKLKLHRSRVLLRQLLGSLLEDSQTQATAKQIDWSMEWELPQDYLFVDGVLVKMLVRLLLTDALLSTPAQGSIRIHFQLQDQALLLSLRDGRPGIPEVELEQMAQPFFIPSEGEMVHSGLELAIVKHIVALHQGHLSAHNLGEGGVEFQVRLPLS